MAFDRRQLQRDRYRYWLDSPCKSPPDLCGDGVIYGLFEADGRADLGTEIAITLCREAWPGRIQLWHVGSYPDLAGLDVELIDAREVQRRHGGRIDSWALKGFAVRHSGLARCLWLDWDAYPVLSPAALFAALDRFCVVVWPNPPQFNSYPPDLFGHFLRPEEIVRPVQGGQILIDCQSYWRGVMLQAAWDSDSELRRRYDDQPGWQFGLSVLKLPHLFSGPMPWVPHAWVCHYDGKPAVVHRVACKLWPDCVPRWNLDLPKERRVQELFRELNRDGYVKAVLRPCGHGSPNRNRQKEQLRREWLTRRARRQ